MAQSIAEVLGAAWQDFLTGLQFYLPHVLAMISLLVVGLLIAWLVSFVARHLLRWGRFDSMAEHFGAAEILKRAGLPAASIVVASLLFWLVWAAFMLSGLGALGVSGIETLSANFVNFLPRLVVAVVMLGVAIAIGIGGGHVARRILERQFPETPRNEARPDHMPHL